MSALLNNAIFDASNVIDIIRADLRLADVRTLSAKASEKEAAAKSKAWAFVWLEATTERFIRALLSALIAEINSQAVPQNKLRRNLYALLFAKHLQSGHSTLNALGNRSAMFVSMDDVNAVILETLRRPFGGKTPRGSHFECLWNIFGFPGAPVPTPRHNWALTQLAESRNKVAHGEVDAIGHCRREDALEIIKKADMLEECLMHLWQTATDYLNNAGYRIP